MLSTPLTSSNERLQETTISADGDVPTEIGALIPLLHHSNPAIGEKVARALERLAPDSVEPLLAAFAQSVDHGVQARVAQILAKIGDDRALELLVDLVGVEVANHCQGNVRRIAARGLGKMVQPHLAVSRQQLAIDKLIWALLFAEDWALRYAAALSLGEIATLEAKIALQQAALQERDRVVQARIKAILHAFR